MNFTNEIYSWMNSFIFIVGVMLLPVGLGFIFTPEKLFKLANKVNHWIGTDEFFNKINAPVYKERFFYRHHPVFAAIIILLSGLCLYMLTAYLGIERIIGNLSLMTESEFENWLFVTLYYVLLLLLLLVLLFGVVLFIRPSVLKPLEKWGNRWVDTDNPLKFLDKRKELPGRILPGNPRIFGFLVTIGSIYIIWQSNPL